MLNRAAGRGLFEQYNLAQELFIRFAYHITCVLAAPDSFDTASAQYFVAILNDSR